MAEEQKGHGQQKPLPQSILDMNYAFARTAMLVASVRLHIFTFLATQALTPTELAARADILPEPATRLLKGLESLELVKKEGEAYQLTPLADYFLVEGRSSYLGGDTLAMVDYVPAWFALDETLRTSTPYRDLGDAATAEAFFAPRVIDLFPIIFPIASRIAADLPLREEQTTALHVLDVGAGSAPWSAAFAFQYPSAHVTALDLPAVVAQGREHIASQGLTERYTWIEADIETFAFPSHAYDLILCGHVVRFISDERAKALFTRLTESLRPGGTLLIADIYLSEDRSGPPPAITLDLSMLVNTAQGRIRTVGEIASWLGANDLQDIERLHVAGPFPIVVARRKERL
jgi:SAM-dependent methyltransferase